MVLRRTGVQCITRTCATWTVMWCDALAPALRVAVRRAVRGGLGAPAQVLVGAACVLGLWAGWRRACCLGGQGGRPRIGRASRAVLACCWEHAAQCMRAMAHVCMRARCSGRAVLLCGHAGCDACEHACCMSSGRARDIGHAAERHTDTGDGRM
jgi:hypothetical protein